MATGHVSWRKEGSKGPYACCRGPCCLIVSVELSLSWYLQIFKQSSTPSGIVVQTSFALCSVHSYGFATREDKIYSSEEIGLELVQRWASLSASHYILSVIKESLVIIETFKWSQLRSDHTAVDWKIQRKILNVTIFSLRLLKSFWNLLLLP